MGFGDLPIDLYLPLVYTIRGIMVSDPNLDYKLGIIIKENIDIDRVFRMFIYSCQTNFSIDPPTGEGYRQLNIFNSYKQNKNVNFKMIRDLKKRDLLQMPKYNNMSDKFVLEILDFIDFCLTNEKPNLAQYYINVLIHNSINFNDIGTVFIGIDDLLNLEIKFNFISEEVILKLNAIKNRIHEIK